MNNIVVIKLPPDFKKRCDDYVLTHTPAGEKIARIAEQLEEAKAMTPEKLAAMRKERERERERIYADIDYTDTAERRAWEKKWDVLQTIRTHFISNGHPPQIRVPIQAFTIKGRTTTEIDGVLDGLEKRENCIFGWHRDTQNYEIFFLLTTHPKRFEEVYRKTKVVYEKFAKTYQDEIRNEIVNPHFLQTPPKPFLTNEVKGDRTGELERRAHEVSMRIHGERAQERLERQRLKNERILRSAQNKYEHAVDTIIEFAEHYGDKSSFSVDYYYFNFESRMDASKLLERFLEKLKENGCFKLWHRTNYTGGTRFGFQEVDIEKLKEYKATILDAKRPTPPNLSADFEATRKAHVVVLERELEEGKKEEAIADRVLERLNIADTSKVQPQNGRPYCMVEGKWGFLKFNKQGEKIKIGNADSQHFRLLQCLTEPFGIAKAVDTVFEAIRENVKYKSRSGVYTSSIDKRQKTRLIEYAIKELQKGNKLRGRLAFRWDDLKTKIWLEYL